MAEEKKVAVQEKKTPAKKTEASKMDKFISWCKKLPSRIAKPFKNMWYELKKVSWPSKRKLIACSVTVLLFMLFMGIVIGLLDLGATQLVSLLVL
ncbi:MAG: preprotein translocase subunit SecE [Clostridiales bacterium]|nr:preprotein translocase subunit SecE [Clostridiales bacterium]